MTLRKKITVSALALSMLTASLGGLPLSQKGLAEKLGLVHTAYASEAGLPSNAFLERMNELYAALVAGDPADVQDVRNLRDEIASLDETTNQQLLDPIWNKISAKLPESVDQVKLKASMFQIIKAVGSLRFDAGASDLEAIRTNPEFRATLKTIAAAGGDANINIDDFIVFMFGDGGSRKGIEGTISSQLSGMSLLELMGLLGNKQGIVAVLLQSMDKLLGETDAYKFSSILRGLDITPQDVRSTVLNFQNKLKKDEPAINAMTIAYIRTSAKETAKISEDGLEHIYSLKVFGIVMPGLALKWSKVSGSEEVTVNSAGVVTIPKGVKSASAVIQAKLVNPYGGSAKLIFEKEVTLTPVVQGNVFPVELFLERMNKLNTALVAGGSSDVKDVRRLREEIADLRTDKDMNLIDPIWKSIAAKLPKQVNHNELKKGLFEIIKAVSAIPYDTAASQLEAIRSNPEFQATLDILAEAGKASTLSIDDFLILMFGDGGENRGVEGTVLDRIAAMDSKALTKMLKDESELEKIKVEAFAAVLADREGYALSELLNNLQVKPKDVASMVRSFQSKLKHDKSAVEAMTTAYIRSNAAAAVNVTENGRRHTYTMTVLGVELPASSVKWKKVSGSKDVKVDSKGIVTISEKVKEGSIVIQAELGNYFGGRSNVIFKQEITLINEDGAVDPKAEVEKIVEELENKLDDIVIRLILTKDDLQKVVLLGEVIKAGKDSVQEIVEVEGASGAIKAKAVNNVNNEVKKMINIIFRDLLK